MSTAVHDGVFDSLEHAFSHGSTFAPNELAMAAGLATLRELDERGSSSARRASASCLLELTRAARRAHDVVRDVRGLGLMWAIEFGEPEPASRRTGACSTGCRPGSSRSSSSCRSSREHRILSQVAGHGMAVIKGLPPLVRHGGGRRATSPTALDEVIAKAGRPTRVAGLALRR